MYVCKDSAAPAHARTRAHRPAAPHQRCRVVIKRDADTDIHVFSLRYEFDTLYCVTHCYIFFRYGYKRKRDPIRIIADTDKYQPYGAP